MISTSDKIPIIAICGFLGAGKTTMLNHILKQENGRKIAVIVNDFGSINVDSLLITSQTEDTMRLSNGAVCCQIGEGGAEEMIDRLANKYSIIEMIIIEASGAAEPDHLAASLSGLDNNYARFDSLVYVVDGAEYAQTKIEHPQITEHLAASDCVVLNKTDLMSHQQRAALKEELEELVPNALLIESDHGQVDTELLLDRDESRDVQLQLTASHDHAHHDHLHDAMVSTTVVINEPLDPQKLFAFLDSPPKGVYRLKGWLNFGLKGLGYTFIIQMVGRRWKMHLYKGSKELTGNEILVIGGKSLDVDLVEQRLKSCVDTDPQSVSHETMLDVVKYDTE